MTIKKNKGGVIIDCIEISDGIRKEISEHVQSIGLDVCLAVVQIDGDDASSIYVRNKKRACESVGMKSYTIRLSNSTTEEELLDVVDMLNKNANIHGILVQLPLTNGINQNKIIEAIDPNKDVDGLHHINMGKLAVNDPSGITPCTATGVMEVLKSIGMEDLSGVNVAMIGRSNLVGKPLSTMLINSGATVTVCNSTTVNLEEITSLADIVISAVGQPKMITSNYIKEDAIVIDIGINRDENGNVCGDVDLDDVINKVSYITPVPKGIGKLTVTMLLMNTLLAYHKQIGG